MRKPALITQVLAVNTLLITATVLAALVAARLHIDGEGQRRQALVLIAAILATVLVNALVLRRRFAPLERIIATMERADLDSGVRAPNVDDADSADVVRLHDAFNRMLTRLEVEREQRASAVVKAQENERARIARDLHDEVNQSLTGILLRLEATAAQAPPAVREELADTKKLTAQAMEELVRLARELRPATLDDHGLEAALRTQADRFAQETGAEVRLDLDGAVHLLGEDEQLVVYRVVQESLSNVAQHAGATHVDVEISGPTDGEILVRVHDDGRGLEAPRRRDSPGGHGLIGMRERARLAGGRVDVRSEHDGGTTVELRIKSAT